MSVTAQGKNKRTNTPWRFLMMRPSHLAFRVDSGALLVKSLKQTVWRAGCLLTGVFVFSLCACGGPESDQDSADIVQAARDSADIAQTARDSADIAQVVTLPDFASIKDTKQRKKQFFEFMQPLIQAENDRIKERRLQILKLYDAFREGQELSAQDREWLRGLCKAYRVSSTDASSEETFRQLLMHVDAIPLELALAQAANESAWGTSKFARKGNNVFGERCIAEGCGIVPRRRAPDAAHEVTTFDVPIHSVISYIHNLNSHPAYHQLRVLRYEKRRAGERPDGYTLALGLQKYSEAGMDYVHRIRAMMRHNKDLIPIPESEPTL